MFKQLRYWCYFLLAYLGKIFGEPYHKPLNYQRAEKMIDDAYRMDEGMELSHMGNDSKLARLARRQLPYDHS